MALALVKRCPSCGTEHAPQRLRCGCGALLAGVDLSEPTPPETTADASAPSLAAELTRPAAAGLVCAHVDCGQANPPGAERCLYCNRPIGAASALFIRWPWGEHEALVAELLIGRVPPAPPALIERLERQHTNVSRRHALLRLTGDQLSIEDLGSANGTFVNEIRLPAHQPMRLHRGATLRFGADLCAAIDADADA